MQVHNSPQRVAGDESVYNNALFAANRYGVNYLLTPAEMLSDDDLVVEEPAEPGPVEIAEMARDARSINEIWTEEALEEQRRESRRTFAEAETLADDAHDAGTAEPAGAEHNGDFVSHRQAAVGEVKQSSAKLPVLPAASASFARVGYGNGHAFSEKLPLQLPARPAYRRALKAARRHDRRRSLARQLVRLGGIVLIAAAILLITNGCITPGQDERIYVDGFEAAPGQPDMPAGSVEDDRQASDVPDEPFAAVESPEVKPVRVEATPSAGGSDDASASDEGESQVRVHVVRKGDSLYAIARRHYGEAAAWRRIARANHIDRPNTIYVGQELVLPGLSPDGSAPASSESDVASEGSGSGTEPVATANVESSPTGPLARAAELQKKGQLAEARRMLSSALYSLNAADEQQALDTLASLNRQLLATTGDDGDCELYTVQKGDSLYSIARDRGVTWQSLMKLNQLSSERILPGQRLRVLRGQPRLIVVRSRGQLDLWLGDHFLKRYAIGVGVEMPSGHFTVRRKVARPEFEGIPAGDKRNPLGSRMLDVGNPTANVHGSPESTSAPNVPGVMMRNADIEELFDIVRHGTPVEIR